MPTTTRLHAQLATLAAGWREQAEALALLAKCARGTRRNDELRAQRCAWPPRGGEPGGRGGTGGRGGKGGGGEAGREGGEEGGGVGSGAEGPQPPLAACRDALLEAVEAYEGQMVPLAEAVGRLHEQARARRPFFPGRLPRPCAPALSRGLPPHLRPALPRMRGPQRFLGRRAGSASLRRRRTRHSSRRRASTGRCRRS